MADGEQTVKKEIVGEEPPSMAELMCMLVAIQQGMAAVRQELSAGLNTVRHENEQFTEAQCAMLRKEMKEELGAMADAMQATAGQVRKMSAQLHSTHPVGSWRAPGWQSETDEESEGDEKENPPRTVSPPCPPLAQPTATPSKTASPPHQRKARSPPAAAPPRAFPQPAAASSVPPRRHKPQEFDGRVSLEAYLAQFEFLARAQGWGQEERALNLVSSLKGPALEVLSQLTPAQQESYADVVSVLERRYGNKHQAEVFRARFRARVRGRGETLQQLAQDLEYLVRKAYPRASEETAVLLLRDQFIDALEDAQLQIYVKQAHVADLQEALVRALEFESFVNTSAGRSRTDAERNQRFRRSRAKDGPGRNRAKPFRGACWNCKQTGHKRQDCRQSPAPNRPRSVEREGQYVYQPCCWDCGQLGHLSRSCPQIAQAGRRTRAGNTARLGSGAAHQPSSPRPHSR